MLSSMDTAISNLDPGIRTPSNLLVWKSPNFRKEGAGCEEEAVRKRLRCCLFKFF